MTPLMRSPVGPGGARRQSANNWPGLAPYLVHRGYSLVRVHAPAAGPGGILLGADGPCVGAS
ncbi:hypothetical protein WBG99_28880 [Streptomyces sp. TG1A-60]|uniref:hypothetical protein n=1 Tax=Streptomyces sp. TG1A-60 TaxID=3129111 RepID=UPI0030CE5C26